MVMTISETKDIDEVLMELEAVGDSQAPYMLIIKYLGMLIRGPIRQNSFRSNKALAKVNPLADEVGGQEAAINLLTEDMDAFRKRKGKDKKEIILLRDKVHNNQGEILFLREKINKLEKRLEGLMGDFAGESKNRTTKE
jgi:hypothetical protein